MTVEQAEIDDLVRVLAAQQAAWNERPLVKQLYQEWHEMIRDRLASISAPTIELGSGFGAFRETVPDVVLTDIAETPWADAVVDAERMPYDDGSVGNLVLIDVFHHLAHPAAFFDEAARVLAPTGRIVILDPYCSALSTVAYTLFHHERVDLSGSAFEPDDAVAGAPLESNQARATLAFFRHLELFGERWPDLRVVERMRLAQLRYPLSGGFSGPRLIGRWAASPAGVIERALSPLRPLTAFRCLVVLERA